MPYGDIARSERRYVDETARTFAERAIGWLYRTSIFVLAGAAALIAFYAFFSRGFGEAGRAIIFFVVPSLWGAYMLAVFDGDPEAFRNLTAPVANGLAVVAALVVGAVWLIDAPVSIANLALGTMEAFFFAMRVSGQPSRHVRNIAPDARIWVRAFLIMVTVLSVFVAIVL